MPTLLEVVVLSLIIELAVVWALRNRTRIIKRVKLERLMYVAGVGTIITQPIGWMVARDLEFSFGFPAALAMMEAIIIAIEAALYRYMARTGWPKGILFSAVANSLVFLFLLATYAVKTR